MGYNWNQGHYDVAAFCGNCKNEIQVIGGITIESARGIIDDPRIVCGQVTAKF